MAYVYRVSAAGDHDICLSVREMTEFIYRSCLRRGFRDVAVETLEMEVPCRGELECPLDNGLDSVELAELKRKVRELNGL